MSRAREFDSQTTIISWSLQGGARVSLPTLPQQNAPKCPFRDDSGKIVIQQTFPDPISPEPSACKSTILTKPPIFAGVHTHGLYYTIGVANLETNSFGESGPLVGGRIEVPLENSNRQVTEIITFGGDTCGQIGGICKDISEQKITASTAVPSTQTPVPTAVSRAGVGQPQPPIEATLLPIGCCASLGILGLLGVCWIRYATGNSGK